MIFKNFLRDVWRPMQLQAEAAGKNVSDVNFSSAMRSYITPQARQQVSSEARESRLGLARRGLDLQKEQLKTQKSVAPYAIGLGAANVGLTGLTGWQAQTEADRRKKLLQQYIDEIKATRGQSNGI